MSSDAALRSQFRPASGAAAWAVVAGLIGIATILAVYKPILLVPLALAVPAICLAWHWPESFTIGVLGLLYLNATAVAVRFHGVPTAVGAALPLLLFIPIGWRWLKGTAPTLDTTGQLVIAFWLAQLFSLQFSEKPSVSIKDVIETATEGLLLYLLVYNAVNSVTALRRVTWVLLV